MFNSQLPDISELPTSNQLLKSTLLAVVAASAILVTIILPSEYGVDPTGIGRVGIGARAFETGDALVPFSDLGIGCDQHRAEHRRIVGKVCFDQHGTE